MTINTLLQSAYRKIILTFLNFKKKAYNVNTNIVIVIPHLSNEPFPHKAPYPKDAGKIFLVEKDSSVCDGEARSYLQYVTILAPSRTQVEGMESTHMDRGFRVHQEALFHVSENLLNILSLSLLNLIFNLPY